MKTISRAHTGLFLQVRVKKPCNSQGISRVLRRVRLSSWEKLALKPTVVLFNKTENFKKCQMAQFLSNLAVSPERSRIVVTEIQKIYSTEQVKFLRTGIEVKITRHAKQQ